MPVRLQFHDLIDLALTEAPSLARELMNVIQDELEAQPQHFALRESWRRVRGDFVGSFESRLQHLLQTALRGEDPLARTQPRTGSLSLVDESQAQQDVAIAQVTQASEDASRAELHQLSNFFAALRGTARARDRDNPLRPALFAHALQHALSISPVPASVQAELMRVAAQPMARTLHRLYLRASEALKAAQLSDMVASHGQDRGDALAHQRLAAARGVGARPTVHGTLDGLSRRVDAMNSRRQALADTTRPFVQPSGPDMLSRLYDQILADPRLLPPLKGLLARLQIAVVRLARSDNSLLRDADHPTWALLNRVAAYGMGFDRADDEELQAFLGFMDHEAQRLVEAPAPTAAQFEQVLASVDARIDQQARHHNAGDTDALAALERGQQRQQWTEVVREQIDQQIADAPLGPRMYRFLQTSWVDVIVDAMVRHGRDSREALDAVELVDAVLDSLITPRDMAARESLRLRLPVLIQRLHAGCDGIGLDVARRDAALNELMGQHARLLRGLPALDAAERRAPAPRAERAQAAPSSADAIVQRLMDERESQVPSMWLMTDVNRGELPTVPVQLYSEHDSPEARIALQLWMDGLRVGRWFHLCLQGDWQTLQIAWISDGRQYVFFVGRESQQRISLTRRALEALLANGLITALDDDSLVQRAVDTLMSDLDGGR
ncbi:MAG: hypothetical protein DI603_19680 [Roseateles depolymerans]|uniref:DUF1631 domain-containing protein n=1 Tax=Roseateles depolymerans TaxID=76731 RepID=A0A2W5D8M1_9BURK|nr:MAG: hypothetical protein DI603_19680 [Roseateles depolymerans]